jgi:hypothetical protein
MHLKVQCWIGEWIPKGRAFVARIMSQILERLLNRAHVQHTALSSCQLLPPEERHSFVNIYTGIPLYYSV